MGSINNPDLNNTGIEASLSADLNQDETQQLPEQTVDQISARHEKRIIVEEGYLHDDNYEQSYKFQYLLFALSAGSIAYAIDKIALGVNAHIFRIPLLICLLAIIILALSILAGLLSVQYNLHKASSLSHLKHLKTIIVNNNENNDKNKVENADEVTKEMIHTRDSRSATYRNMQFWLVIIGIIVLFISIVIYVLYKIKYDSTPRQHV